MTTPLEFTHISHPPGRSSATDAGHITDERRQEFTLLSDVSAPRSRASR